jgi:arginine deiminase
VRVDRDGESDATDVGATPCVGWDAIGAGAAAYGGPGWRARSTSLREELGSVWASCGQALEWSRLESVLLHRPGRELDRVGDPDAALMLERPDLSLAAEQHDALADAYRAVGVVVSYVDPPVEPPPNLMFAADLFFMTPEGAVLGRPASEARAGEERWIQQRLAALGVPIVRAIGGHGTFEGADAMWLDPRTVLLGVGLRTNPTGADQVAGVLADMDVDVITVELPPETMHLMGQLRIVDRDLAYYWEGRFPADVLRVLAERGLEAKPFPDVHEAEQRAAHNFVTLAPRSILMPDACPVSRAAFEADGVTCRTTAIDEIVKATGGIGCLTGILRRAPIGHR